MSKSYLDVIKKQQMKDGNLASILRSAILFYKVFQDDEEIMELTEAILNWYKAKGLVTIDDEDQGDNVLDFMAEYEKRQILKGNTDGF